MILNKSEAKAQAQSRDKNSANLTFGASLSRLLSLLPPRDDQPLLKYVVFRLGDVDTLPLAAARKKSLLTVAGILIFVVAISLAYYLLNIALHSDDIYWINISDHTLLETFGGLVSIFIGMILAWEYYTSGKRNILFLVYAFFSAGIFGFFHAFSDHCHNLFVWYHSFGALLSSFFFVSAALIDFRSDLHNNHPVWIRRFSIFSGVFLIILFAASFRIFYSYFPDVLITSFAHHTNIALVSGKFSASAYAVNHLSAVLFLTAGFFFVRGFLKSNDLIYLIFGTSMLLFFVSELFFVFSKLWCPVWWYWHFIKGIIFSGLLLGLAYGFTKSFHRLDTSRIQLANLLEKIEMKNSEIENALVTLKETQRYLNESEKLASIGKMAAMMAHEIRNPLGAISNSVGVLKKYSLRPEESTELLSLVEDEMDRLNKLTDDFLSFAKPSHLKRSEVKLNSLLDETLSLLKFDKTKAPEIVFRKSFAPDIPVLMLDRNHIKQVFINILMNSIQAISRSGVITIQTIYREMADEVEITFSDTGTGIPEDVISQVFQPFFTTKDKGLGLGLNIIHKIIKEHGGYIVLTSKEGEGTEIKLSFPAGYQTVHSDTFNLSIIPDPGLRKG